MIGLPYEQIKKVIKYIIKKVKAGKIDIERINRSVEKIISIKEKYNINDNLVQGFDIEKINEEIMEINKKADK